MKKELILNGRKVEYDFQLKSVKNINLRIKSDGSVFVSSNRNISERTVEEFLISKADFIIKAQNSFAEKKKTPSIVYYTEDEVKTVILDICEKIYPYFRKKGVHFPEIKFRKMISQWGNCRREKGVLTFNTNLRFAPKECIEYVVLHEFTHFLQPNHSELFYRELFKVCPDWKKYRQALREIDIRTKD